MTTKCTCKIYLQEGIKVKTIDKESFIIQKNIICDYCASKRQDYYKSKGRLK